jgi:hypothetical protein
MLGVVLELLVVEKQLLARGEYKLGSAVTTLQDSINEFHGRLPQSRSKSAIIMRTRRSRIPVFDTLKATRARAAEKGSGERHMTSLIRGRLNLTMFALLLLSVQRSAKAVAMCRPFSEL